MTGRPNAFAAALGVFTLIPAPVLPAIDRDTARRSVLALPWLGLALGVAAAAACLLVGALGGGPLLAAVAGLGVLAAATGAMHLDGLADTADGLGSRAAPEDALRIMKQSDIGPMGVVSLVFVLAAGLAALAAPRVAPVAPWVLAAGPMVARVMVLGATRTGTPAARPGGFGALFIGVTSTRGLATGALLAALAASALGWGAGGPWGAAAFAGASALAWTVAGLWGRHLTRRLGGLTGDTVGALVEVAQVTFWIACAVIPWR